MNSTPSSPDLESRAALREQDAGRGRVMFWRVADRGAEMVEMVVQRAREEAATPVTTPTRLPELATAYDRLARSLRRTVLMIERLTAPPPPARTPPGPRPGSASRPAPAMEELSDEDVANMSDEEIEERLEALDRLEGLEGVEHDDDAEFAGMSHEEIVLAILRDPDGTGRSAAEREAGVVRANPGITPLPAPGCPCRHGRDGMPMPPGARPRARMGRKGAGIRKRSPATGVR